MGFDSHDFCGKDTTSLSREPASVMQVYVSCRKRAASSLVLAFTSPTNIRNPYGGHGQYLRGKNRLVRLLGSMSKPHTLLVEKQSLQCAATKSGFGTYRLECCHFALGPTVVQRVRHIVDRHASACRSLEARIAALRYSLVRSITSLEIQHGGPVVAVYGQRPSITSSDPTART